MKRAIGPLAVSVIVASLMSGVVMAAETAPKTMMAHHASSAVLVPAGELKWSDVPEFPGLKMAPVHGDPAKGPSHFFLRMPGGFAAGMHFHNADHWVAVVSGTLVLGPEGGAEKSLPAGSGFGFTGKKKHTTKCAAGEDCLLFIDARGKWDVIPADKK